MSKSVAKFFVWWAGGLAALLPAALRRLIGIDPDLVVVEVKSDQLIVGVDRHGESTALGQVGRSDADAASKIRDLLTTAKMSRAPVALRLTPDQVLQKELALPNAVTENLRQVLEFEMEQQTPFHAEQVYFGGIVTGPGTGGSGITVRLAAVPKETVDHATAALEKMGLAPALVGVGETQSRIDRRINLAAHVGTSGGLSRRDGFLMVLVAILIVAALTVPGFKYDIARARVEGQIADLSPSANKALGLRQKIETALAGAGTVARAKQATPSAVRLLEELSARLPDETWLVQMNLVGGEVTIEGTSPSATALASILEASSLIESVRFQTPITRNNITDREQFNLSLRAAIPEANAKSVTKSVK